MNCRGLPDIQIRRDVPNYLRSKSPAIIFLQYIYIDENGLDNFLMEQITLKKWSFFLTILSVQSITHIQIKEETM